MKFKNLILSVVALALIVGNVIYLLPKYQQLSDGGLKNTPVIQAIIDQTIQEILNERKKLAISDEDFIYGNPNSANVFANFYSGIRSEVTFRIKVWGKGQQVIWSDLPELIGQKFPDNAEVVEAFDGEEAVEVKTNAAQGSDKSEILTESLYNNYLEIYTPIRGKNNQIVGLIELYKSIDGVVADLRNQFYGAAFLVISGSVVLLAVLTWFLKKTRE